MNAREMGDPEAGARERGWLLARAGVVGAGTLASRVLGLVRDTVMAAIFDRDATDMWSVAFTIPNALRSLLAEGVVASAVVPVLSQKLAQDGAGERATKVLFARLRGLSLLVLAVATALGVALARPLTELFADGYPPHKLERTVTLTRAVFPYLFFMGTAALGTAALNAKRRFAVAAFAPGLLNVALIAAALALPPMLAARGMDVTLALAAGALVGGLLQIVAQQPALRRIGYSGWPRFALDADVRGVIRRFLPLTVGTGIYYIDLVLSRRFLSELGTGAQSYFWFASRLCDFPQGIFVMALSTAALPSLSMLAADGRSQELSRTWAHGMGLALFVALPASAALAVLGEPIVVALFERGQFDAHAAHETARALRWQGAAIWTVAAVRQTVPAFYALGDTRTPVLVSAIDLCAFIVLALVLRRPLGHVGISAAVAGSSAVQMALLLVGLKWRIGDICAGDLARSALRTGVASGVAAVAGWQVARLFAGAPGLSGIRAAPAIGGTLAFALAFLGVARVLRAPELEVVWNTVNRRRPRAR
ncbi:MAG: murein biosynthesis integral membrane protein MurJ [Myxococcota bacterium]|nr:murein biosynthesis integral membrane protein MurJ [Myxococcota bacterium]